MCMWICGGFAPLRPMCAFGDQKGLIWKKDMSFGNPPHHGTKCRFFKKSTFFWVFSVPKGGALGCLGFCRQTLSAGPAGKLANFACTTSPAGPRNPDRQTSAGMLCLRKIRRKSTIAEQGDWTRNPEFAASRGQRTSLISSGSSDAQVRDSEQGRAGKVCALICSDTLGQPAQPSIPRRPVARAVLLPP